MDLSQLNSVAGTASERVASALAPRTTGSAAAHAASDTNGAASSTGSSSTDSSTITANDFLTLLVSELKNQDPTQPTDPNQYIQQLVGVNSLQQLIQINQGLTNFEDTITGASNG
jgi:flagellar basal-body rod modification protein FlgD